MRLQQTVNTLFSNAIKVCNEKATLLASVDFRNNSLQVMLQEQECADDLEESKEFFIPANILSREVTHN